MISVKQASCLLQQAGSLYYVLAATSWKLVSTDISWKLVGADIGKSMSAIYVTEPGCQVRVSSRQIIVTKGKEKLLSMPLIKVERLLLFGQVQVTAQAVNILLDEGVDITYLSAKGKFRGKIQPAESKNVLVRVADRKSVV